MRLEQRTRARVRSEHRLLLKGMLLWTVVGGAVLGAWHYGLLQAVWRADRSGLALGITLAFAGAAARGSCHVVRLSRVLNHMGEVEGWVRSRQNRGLSAAPGDSADRSCALPVGCVSEHVRSLQIKARLAGGRAQLDQRLLLEALEADLRRGQELGWFVADLLLSLGLLGTVIGFILMLDPIRAPDTADQGGIEGALAAMSGGMAVALYTTLVGLIGGTLLKLQGFLLNGAVQELIGRTARLTEIFVLPALERMQHDAAA